MTTKHKLYKKLHLARLRTQLLLPWLMNDYQIYHRFAQYVWSCKWAFEIFQMNSWQNQGVRNSRKSKNALFRYPFSGAPLNSNHQPNWHRENGGTYVNVRDNSRNILYYCLQTII